MNPPFAPTPRSPWGVTVPDGLANRSALHGGPSPDLTHQAVEGVLGCQSCGKEFARPCDLNKHVKTHSRPFKCPVAGCQYQMSGLPTEQELDRHFNDKHSTEPMTFSCLWRGCSYRSKRESNCKQHMEKVHGLNYVRSRAVGKGEATGEPLDYSGDLFHEQVNTRHPLTIRTAPNFLLTSGSLGQPSSLPPDASSPMSIASVPYGPDVYDPWNSPATGLRDSEPFLQGLTQTYTPANAVTVDDSEWLKVPADPRLHNPDSSGNNTPDTSPVTDASSSRYDMLRARPAIMTARTSPSSNTQVLTPVSESSPSVNKQSAFAREVTTPQGSEGYRGQGQLAGQSSGAGGHLNPFGKRQVRFDGEPGDDSDGEDEPPVKRSRTPGGMDEESGDPKMICPFRKAHPEIYDLNVHAKYFSCHTEHHNISTVVRHLGRPAHNLEVDNSRQAISSFNVTDDEHGHPAAGLCKKCWRSFTDRQAFEAHFLTKCETVSRSKREKFQILLDTFCRTVHDRDSEGGDDVAADVEGETEVDAPTSSRSSLRPEDIVSRREYEALADRVATLERMLAARMPQSTPRTMPTQGAVVQAFAPSPVLPSQTFDYYSYDSGSMPSRPAVARESRASVAQGLDTHTLGMGVTGFYRETDQPMASFRPTASRRTSTARHVSPLAGTGGPIAQHQPATGAQHQQQRTVSDPAIYGTETGQRMAVAGVNNPSLVQQLPASSSSNTQQAQHAFGAPRERWDQGSVEAGVVQGMGFTAEDITEYLNMDSQ